MQHELIAAEFTPAEAGEITGVSPDVQRDWRRRKLLIPPAGRVRAGEQKHNRFGVRELGYLLAMKTFSAAGVSMERMTEAASLADIAVEGLVNTIEISKLRGETPLPSRSESVFVVVSGETASKVQGRVAIAHFFETHASIFTQIFDCRAAAELIIARAPRPCWTMRVSP